MLMEPCCRRNFHSFWFFIFVLCTTTSANRRHPQWLGKLVNCINSFQSRQDCPSPLHLTDKSNIQLKAKTHQTLELVGKTETGTIIGQCQPNRNIVHLFNMKQGPVPAYLLLSKWIMWSQPWGSLPRSQNRLLCSVWCPWQHNRRLGGAGRGLTEDKERMAWNTMQLLNILFINFKLYQFLDFWIPTERRKKTPKKQAVCF